MDCAADGEVALWRDAQGAAAVRYRVNAIACSLRTFMPRELIPRRQRFLLEHAPLVRFNAPAIAEGMTKRQTDLGARGLRLNLIVVSLNRIELRLACDVGHNIL
jgi:hypothetical protein